MDCSSVLRGIDTYCKWYSAGRCAEVTVMSRVLAGRLEGWTQQGLHQFTYTGLLQPGGLRGVRLLARWLRAPRERVLPQAEVCKAFYDPSQNVTPSPNSIGKQVTKGQPRMKAQEMFKKIGLLTEFVIWFYKC